MSEILATKEVPGQALPTEQSARRIASNSVAQIGARGIIALARLAIAGMIVRACGSAVFGEYALLFGLLSLGEWLVDFGTTDVFVRDMCRQPENRLSQLRTLTAAKFVQIPAAIVLLAVLLVALRYPAHVVGAGLVGSSALVFFGYVLVFRVLFRSTMTVEREAMAEVAGALAAIPLTALVCYTGGDLFRLILAHSASRCVYFAVCAYLGRREFKLSIEGATAKGVREALLASGRIGLIGFLVGGYENVDVFVLSKMVGFDEVARYSAAQRLVWPLLMALTAVSASFYPVLASRWPNERAAFAKLCQQTVDSVVILMGLGLSVVWAAPAFLMSLLGGDLARHSELLVLFGVLCLAKAITSSVGPMFYILKQQRAAMRFVSVALVMRGAAAVAVAPKFGIRGVLWSAIAIELLFGALPAVWIFQRKAGLRFTWRTTAAVLGVTALSAAVARLAGGGAVSAALGPVVWCCLAAATGVVTLRQLESLREARPVR